MNRQNLESTFHAALERVDPASMVREALTLDGELLTIRGAAGDIELELSRFNEIVVVGAGKAGAAMALGLESVLGGRISGGAVAVKYGHIAELETIELLEAGHPVPDENGVRAAERIARIAVEADEETLVLVLLSGGGSALLTLPYRDRNYALELEDIQETTRLLLECGAPIQEINTVRKHLSGVSGGRFCALAEPATVASLILSDVVGDELASIASGLTSPDAGRFSDALAILDRYQIKRRIPERARALLEAGDAGRVPDSPESGHPAFTRVHNALIGTNALALEAARVRASELGYRAVVLSSQVEGEAREVAKVYAAIAKDLARGGGPAQRPACILGGGETTVKVSGAGKGGRNTELALAFLLEIEGRPGAFAGVSFLSGATDGTDGPTDAAGAFASTEVLERYRSLRDSGEGIASIREVLAENDSYPFFESLGRLLRTGPTNTNVCDIQILLVE